MFGSTPLGDSGYFLGAVALVNSLRLTGNEQPITFLDLGLTPAQHEVLSAHCDVVDIERDARDHPYTFQPYPYVLGATGTCVIIDSDVIVTGRLDSVIDAASTGKIACFADNFQRFTPEWASIFELREPLVRSDPYVNSGLLALDAGRNRSFLERWWGLCRALEIADPPDHRGPIGFADQDALNALLMSEYRDARSIVSEPRFAIGHNTLRHTEVVDVDALRCTFDAQAVVALHSTSQPKPWAPRAQFLLRRSAYITCLRRCLSGPGLTITLPEEQLPRWLRNTPRATVELRVMQTVAPLGRAAYKVKQELTTVGSAFDRRRDSRGPA